MSDLDGRTPVTITFELHELAGLAQLYEDAPDYLPLVNVDGVYLGPSVDLAMLRIAEALSRASGNREGLLRAGAIRARLDQGE